MLTSHSRVLKMSPSSIMHFAADHLVARGGVAAEIDAPDEELLALVDIDSEIHLAVGLVGIEVGLGHGVDVAVGAVKLFQVLEALPQLFGGEDVARGHPEHRAHQHLRRAEQFHAHEIDLAEAVLPAFFHGHCDVGDFAGLVRIDQRNGLPFGTVS